eukprot:jgi/Ulvmu1/9795/UM056_0035.1
MGVGMPATAGKYSIIMPTYNERRNIGIVTFLINKYLSGASVEYEIIIVDDNSPDGTQDIVKQLQTVFGADKVILAARPGKLGLGTAYKHGLHFASGEFIILMDADLSHHPKYIPDMVTKQRETSCDVVSGTRYKQDGGVYGWDMIRKLTSRGANLLAQLLLQPNASDLTGSFRLYKRSLFERIINEVQSKGYAFQMEMLVRARYAGCSVQEVPIVFVDRFYGDSKLGGSEVIGFLKGLLQLLVTL